MWHYIEAHIKRFPASPAHALNLLQKLPQLEKLSSRCQFSRFDDIGLDDMEGFCKSMDFPEVVNNELKSLKERKSILVEIYDYDNPRSDYSLILAELLPDSENFANAIVQIETNIQPFPPEEPGICRKGLNWVSQTVNSLSGGRIFGGADQSTRTRDLQTGSGQESGHVRGSGSQSDSTYVQPFVADGPIQADSRIELHNLCRYLALERFVREGVINDYTKVITLEHLRPPMPPPTNL